MGFAHQREPPPSLFSRCGCPPLVVPLRGLDRGWGPARSRSWPVRGPCRGRLVEVQEAGQRGNDRSIVRMLVLAL
jgi:hypothetical protein